MRIGGQTWDELTCSNDANDANYREPGDATEGTNARQDEDQNKCDDDEDSSASAVVREGVETDRKTQHR